jgi:hypothetical protein
MARWCSGVSTSLAAWDVGTPDRRRALRAGQVAPYPKRTTSCPVPVRARCPHSLVFFGFVRHRDEWKREARAEAEVSGTTTATAKFK